MNAAVVVVGRMSYVLFGYAHQVVHGLIESLKRLSLHLGKISDAVHVATEAGNRVIATDACSSSQHAEQPQALPQSHTALAQAH